ncbi:MAG: flippase-like domain-containing protein [Rhodocyclales bacterium]|nr:flippase-like domain-containing protein [Rhodocyclales bacterium]
MTSPSKKKHSGIASALIRIVVTASMLFFILRSIDAGEALTTFRQAKHDLLLVALLMQFGSTAVAAYRWQLLMHNLDFGQPLRFYWNSYFKGMFFNQALPTSIGGDAVRVLDVARRGFRKRDAFYGVAIDRLAGLGALVSLAFMAYVLNPSLLPQEAYQPILILTAASLAGLLGISLPRRMAWLDRYPKLVFIKLISVKTHQAFAKERFQLLVSSLLVPLFAMLGFFASGKALGLPFDLMTYFAIVPPALMLTIIPISIAGWGVREGALVGLFSLIGANKSAVLMMSLLYGLMLIIVSLPGLVVFMRGRHPQHKPG